MTEAPRERRLDDPWWFEEPHQAGQVSEVHTDVDGIPMTLRLIAGETTERDLGWVGIVDFHLGVTVDVDLDRRSRLAMSGGHDPSTPLLTREIRERANRKADRMLVEIEATRRTLVAIRDDLGVRPTEKIERRPSEEVRIAANIYNLVAARTEGRPKPGPYIQAYLGCQSRKASGLVRKARDEGLITSEARLGYVDKPSKRTKRGTK